MPRFAELSAYDREIQDIVKYVYHAQIDSDYVWQRARTALLDAIGCAIESVSKSADCRRLLGPTVPGTHVPSGFRVPGTSHCVDPVEGAFDLGTAIRYLDHNDGIAGKDWGHPSDNTGAILPVMDWLCRQEATGQMKHHGPPLTLKTLLGAIIRAYEIQGCMLLGNAFHQYGFDHVILVKLASAAVLPWLMGLSQAQAAACVSHAWMDSAPLRVYRHGENTIPRKGWAAGDACQRAVQFALMVRQGQPGSPTVLSMLRWGFYASAWRDSGAFTFPKHYSDWVIRNVLFKIMPVEGHAISAVEAAVIHRKSMRQGLDSLQDIAEIRIRTTAAAKLIIDKPGKLHNHADRDHCIQYCVAVALIKGADPVIEDFEDSSPFATDPAVDRLRERMVITADEKMTADYLDLDKKSIGSAVSIDLVGGESLGEVLVEHPCGSSKSSETAEKVSEKFWMNMLLGFSPDEVSQIERTVLYDDTAKVSHLVDLLARPRPSPIAARL